MTTATSPATEPLPTIPEARERAGHVANLTRATVADVVRALADVLAPASLTQLRRAAASVTTAADALEAARYPAGIERAVGLLTLRTLEFRALLEEHPDGLARALSVMQRAAAGVLGDADGEPIAEWCGALLAGDAA